jgi:5-methylcytosine-specific restriction protein A
MPQRAKRPCNKSGCNALTDSGHCPAHEKLRGEAKRESGRLFDRKRRHDPFRKIYQTEAWQRVRKAILQRDPLCKIADLCVRRYGTALPSAEVDHIVPIRSGGAELDPDNLQGICHNCHSQKTRRETRLNNQ